MLHLKHHLFGFILLSSFGSAFADEYDPKQDVFDQIINALVPSLIVLLFNTKEAEDEKKSEANIKLEEKEEKEEKEEIENSSRVNLGNSEKLGRKYISIFNKIRQELSPVKIRRAFDDFLFLLSLFVLPCIVFYKNYKEFATPIWIPILFGVTAGFVFFVLIGYYFLSYTDTSINSWGKILALLSLIIDFSHVISDICFILYTKNIPASNFTDVFIYLHAVTGILGSILLLYYIYEVGLVSNIYGDTSIAFKKSEPNLRKLTITITFIWTPIVQMLNMSLLSGNDYYWTKSILALNMIYLSRVINYAEKKVHISRIENVPFGMLYIIFYVIRNQE